MRVFIGVGLFIYEGIRRVGTIMWALFAATVLVQVIVRMAVAPTGAVVAGIGVGYLLYSQIRDNRPANRLAMIVVLAVVGDITGRVDQPGWDITVWVSIATIIVLFARRAYLEPSDRVPGSSVAQA